MAYLAVLARRPGSGEPPGGPGREAATPVSVGDEGMNGGADAGPRSGGSASASASNGHGHGQGGVGGAAGAGAGTAPAVLELLLQVRVAGRGCRATATRRHKHASLLQPPGFTITPPCENSNLDP